MNAKQLQLEDGTKVPAWQCGVCGLVWPEHEAYSSERCCKCGDCGKQIDPKIDGARAFLCKTCWSPHYAKKEAEQLERAELVSDYTGPVSNGSDCFATIDDFLDRVDADGGEIPEVVYACHVRKYQLDAEEIIQNLIENAGTEDVDSRDLNGVPEFTAAVTAFNAANATSPEYWEQDSKRKVAVPKPPSLEEMPVVDYSVEDATSKPQAGNGPEGTT